MIRRVCFRSQFLPCLLWNLSVHSQPEAWRPWEGQYAPPILHYACIMPIPSLQLQKKAPASCTEAEVLVTELWSPRFVTMLCSQLCYETAAKCLKWGCQPFTCRCSQNVMHCRKEICWTCLFETSTPAVPFWNSKHYSLLYCKWSMGSGPYIVSVQPPRAAVSKTWRNDGRVFWAR